MAQRHKHADVIIALAKGKAVQVRDEGTKRWFDVMPGNPIFSEDREYRVKPPAKKYRVALFHTDGYESLVATCSDRVTAENYEFLPDFVRWLTDWIEYEE